MTKRVKVGLAGAGYVANHHLRALRDLSFVEIAGICDTNLDRARETAAKFSIDGAYRSLDELRPLRPEVIHILTPPASHCALALQALDMGCHVFVEKPLADTVEECDQMIRSAADKGLILSVNHSARFDPVTMQAAELVRSGAVGDTLALYYFRGSDYPGYAGGPLPAHYRQGSYPFRDLGVHGVYLLEAFLGPVQDLRESHHSTGANPLLTFDEWRVDAECERGTGHMFLSWNSRPMRNEIVVQGTRGSIHVDCFLQTCELSRDLPGPKQIGMVINGVRHAARRVVQVPWNTFRFATGSLKPSPGIYRGVQEFHQALHENRQPPVGAEEGRRAIHWISQTARAADEEKDALIAARAARDIEPARVLVTGGGGFLGRELVRRLEQRGESVRLLLRRPAAAPSSRVVYGSLGEPDVVDRAVAGTEVVYHAGAAMKGGLAEFEQGTVWGTRNVIESCLRHGVKKLVYVSSMSVFDHAGHPAGQPVREDWRYEPYPERRGAYTRTKLEAERMVIDAIRDRGLPAVILRPGQIFGPGAERVTPNGVIGIAGLWILAGGGGEALPLVYRDDVVDALLLAAEKDDAIGRILNIVDPTLLRQNEYLRRAKPKLGGIRVVKAPVPILTMLAALAEALAGALGRGSPLTPYRIKSLRPLSPFDISAAEKILGWRPEVGVMEGLHRTFGGA